MSASFETFVLATQGFYLRIVVITNVFLPRILLSRSFKFIIGADEVPIMVHEAAFADQSRALRALMQGTMSEGSAGQAKWEDVDIKTFVRFAQFVYTGDYSIPRMIVRSSKQPLSLGTIVDEATPLPDEPQENFWGGFGTPTKKGKKKSYLASAPTVVRTFSSLRFPLLKSRSNFEDTCEPAVSDGPSENIGEVLVIHSSLYVLAEKWGIDSLKRLTLSKIYKTLTMIRLDLPKLDQIIDFVRYTYSNERTPDLENKMDELRELICLYLAAYAELTTGHTAFMALMEEGGPFARDLWKLAAPRINPTNSVEFMM